MVTWFYFFVFILALILTLLLLVRTKKVDSLFIFLSIMVTVNTWGRYLLATSNNLETAILANKILYVGACYMPVSAILVLAMLCELKIPKMIKAALLVYASVVMGFVLTIGRSGIYYKHVELGLGEGYSYLIKTYGPAHVLYTVLVAIFAFSALFCLAYAVIIRKRISFRLVTGLSIICVANAVLYLLERISGAAINFTSLGYLLGIILMMKFYNRANMYDMTANLSYSLEKLNEYGYIVFDKKYRFIKANHVVKKLFPEISDWVVDREVPITESYLYREVVHYLKDRSTEDSVNKVLIVGDEFYELEIRDISYGKKSNVGYLLEFVNRTMEKRYYNAIEAHNKEMQKEVEEQTRELRIQQRKMKELYVQTVTALSEAVDAKDRYTSGHSKRVAKYSKMLAERMGKSKEEQEEIYRAGLLHDVGKIRIPVDIINKPGKLTEEEYNIIKVHSITGYHILSGISGNSKIAIAAKYHHERYDGKGYPNGLAGEKIPEIARILGVADSYDAMTSNRSYRNALPQEVVRNEIERGKGTQFDPVIADIMLQLIDEDKEYEMKQSESIFRRILTVDDEPMNNKIIAHILKDEPMYEVVSVEGGKQALEILEQQRFDLILLDVMMPEMDGLETLKSVRALYDVPVVLMTGDKTLDTSSGFSEYGCNDYITKPFLPILLKEMIYNTMERTSNEG